MVTILNATWQKIDKQTTKTHYQTKQNSYKSIIKEMTSYKRPVKREITTTRSSAILWNQFIALQLLPTTESVALFLSHSTSLQMIDFGNKHSINQANDYKCSIFYSFTTIMLLNDLHLLSIYKKIS